MGKIRTKIIGLEDVEEQQKLDAKRRAEGKKAQKEAAVKKTQQKEEQHEPKQAEQKSEEKKTGEVKVAVKEKKQKKANVARVRGKKYQKAKSSIDQKKNYTLQEALELLKKLKFSSFDESVELHLNVDETGLKGEVEFPHSTGKTVRVVIVDNKVLEQIEQGKLEFDVLITHPSFMPKLAKFAKILGPKGLMPNPKAGTISPTPETVAQKFKKGTIRWKTEPKAPLIHQMIGKVSHGDQALIENAEKFLISVGSKHIQKAVIKTTMSPSLKLLLG